MAVLDQTAFNKLPKPLLQQNYTEEQYKARTKELYANYNFDHPDAVDWDMFASTLEALIQGKPCKIPLFDERLHIR